MKKLLSVILLLVLFYGCSSNKENPTELKHGNSWMFSAQIMSISEKSMFVKSIYGSILTEVVINVETSKENPTQIFDPINNTIKVFPKGLKKDDKVIIFFNGIATNSMPPQISSNNIIWKLSDDAPTNFREWQLFIND